jgi:hypothetical protein
MLNEGSQSTSEYTLTGEYPLQKASRCGETLPFTAGNAAQFWAASVYDYLHDAPSSGRIAMPLIISPHLEFVAQMTLERMIIESCEGSA